MVKSLIVLLLLSVSGQLSAEKGRKQLHTMLDLLDKAYLQKAPGKDAEDIARHVNKPRVQTTSGVLDGSTNSYAHSFYAIPYAVPPVGDLRFQPPQMLDTPDVARNTTLRKAIFCPRPGAAPYTEDCLVLNVFVPLTANLTSHDAPPSARFPVLLFLHGGAFFSGSGTYNTYEGRFLSQVTSTIVVTVNYRLGPLGYLAFDDGENLIVGNQGLKDQQLAMQWVQNNIGNFGGNKSGVTIFGESAGAQSVMFHLLSTISEPMFHRAIMQSNPASIPYPTYEEALEVTDKLIGFLRCNPPIVIQDCCIEREDNYTCLTEASTENLISGMLRIMASEWARLDLANAVEPFRPHIDGSEFLMQPMALFKEGLWNKHKPFIIGSNEEELDVLKYILPLNKALFWGLNQQIFKDWGVHEDTGDLISAKYEEMYPNITDYGLLFGMEMTDIFFGCPTRAMARFASVTSEDSIYYYIFGHSLDGDDCEDIFGFLCGHAYHSVELYFIFRTIEHLGMIPDDHDILVSDQFSTYWGNFAWSGKPSEGPDFGFDGEYPEWIAYSTRPDQNSYIDTNIRIANPQAYLEQYYRGEICDFWDTLGLYLSPPKVSPSPTAGPEETTTSSSVGLGSSEIFFLMFVIINYLSLYL